MSVDSNAAVPLLGRGNDENWRASGSWHGLPKWSVLTSFPPLFSKVAGIHLILRGEYSDFVFPKSDIENCGTH